MILKSFFPLSTFFVLMYPTIGESCLIPKGDKVKIQLAYEILCPYCIDFLKGEFKDVVTSLAPYLEVLLYPYGNAKTLVDQDGKITFECQHGPAECYGNMLHACAIDSLKNITAAVIYNACMMDDTQSTGLSDDEAADQCGQRYSVDAAAIKECANSERGIQLHKYYGEEIKKAGFVRGVPYILVNGVRSENFSQDVCKAIKNPPSPCP